MSDPSASARPWPAARLASAGACAAIALAGLLLAWLAHDAPLAPGLARGWLRADALSALTMIALGALGLAELARGRRGNPHETLAAALFALAAVAGHLGVAALLLVAGGATLAWPGARSFSGRRLPVGRERGAPPGAGEATGPARRSALGALRPAPLLGLALAALGLALVGVVAGEWRHGAPAAGAGLSSPSFVLLLVGALVAGGAWELARGRPPAATPLAAAACLYALLRLFSLGPWNLGWLFAAIVAGGALALGAAWQAAAAPPGEAAGWLGAYLAGLAIAGAGLGSGAGVTMAGYALLAWPILRLGLVGLAGAGGPRRPLWLLSGAVPLTAPFLLVWLAVAAAIAGGLTLLAAVLWAAGLLAAAAVGRIAAAPPGDEPALGAARPVYAAAAVAPLAAAPPPDDDAAQGAGARPVYAAAALSAALGLGAPLVVAGLLGPVAAQLQGGLTPFGEVELWPWAGLIALDAARQPVATLPSLALAALMLILSALCWVALRLARPRGR